MDVNGETLNHTKLEIFQETIWSYYRTHARIFAWRHHEDPYAILVSEIMLQQTQTDRVTPYFLKFMAQFPDILSVAQAPQADIIRAWQGLGYNRRARAVQLACQKILQEYAGIVPDDPIVLQKFWGIGPNTAASISAFAYNRPVVFIETNIRAVFLHEFFNNKTEPVSDQEILILVARTLNYEKPRDWYYALMDYGVFIKKTYGNPNLKSRHYTKQSKFEGSDRQIRGAILRALVKTKNLSRAILVANLSYDHNRIHAQVDALLLEGLIFSNQHDYLSL